MLKEIYAIFSRTQLYFLIYIVILIFETLSGTSLRLVRQEPPRITENAVSQHKRPLTVYELERILSMSVFEKCMVLFSFRLVFISDPLSALAADTPEAVVF